MTGSSIRSADLDRPNPRSDPALAMHARKLVETIVDPGERSLIEEVEEAIFDTDAGGQGIDRRRRRQPWFEHPHLSEKIGFRRNAVRRPARPDQGKRGDPPFRQPSAAANGRRPPSGLRVARAPSAAGTAIASMKRQAADGGGCAGRLHPNPTFVSNRRKAGRALHCYGAPGSIHCGLNFMSV